jgi:hypothetical protein
VGQANVIAVTAVSPDPAAKQINSLPKNSAQVVALSNQQVVLKGQLAQFDVAGATASAGPQLVTPAVAPMSTAPVVTSWRKKSRPVVISVSDPASQPADLGPLARGRR